MEYDFKEVERKWQDYWEKEKIYRFDPNSDKPVYSIDNPPRYASARIHIGHATHYTHIDFIARYKRMRGYNVFFPLCFDVNGMPIEVNVEKKYGIRMREIPRQKFIKMCEDFANANIDGMIEQYKVLGESMDPSIYYQTDAPYYRKITQMSFIDMLENGHVYKAEHPVNWCPRCETAIADAEIEYRSRKTYLNYIKFKLKDGGDIIIATTRPELLCTCQLVAVNPEDERYKDIVGKKAIVPIYGREVDIVADDKVDPNFGTGVVMICSVGDKDDLEWIYRYNLKFLKGIDEKGKMTSLAGKYEGLSIVEARKKIVDDLNEMGLLVKREEIEQNVGVCWRCHTPIEFINKKQWFIRIMDKKDMVLSIADKLNWYPDFMKKRLEEWVNSLEWDWVVSRQRYFATPIPVWECENCGHIVYPSKEDIAKKDRHVDPTIDPPPMDKCPKCGGPLKGCEEVFDTWVDSSITPLYNTFWMRDEKMFKKLYPMSLRPQAHDIIRTWAFYTIVRCTTITGEEPWKDVFIDGFILAPDGRPMHASWGNVVDPMEIVEEYGTDPFRFFAAMCTPGEDTPFRYKDVVRGRKVVIKLWNLGRFAFAFLDEKVESPNTLKIMDRWILSLYSSLVKEVTELMDDYRYDLATKKVVNFLWNVFADHYVEMIKHRLNEEGTKYTFYQIFLGIIKMLAPILPHITEEIYQNIFRKFEGEKSIHLTLWPSPIMVDSYAEAVGEEVKEIIAAIRRWKSSKGIPLNAEIPELVIISEMDVKEGFEDIQKTVKAKDIYAGSKSDIKEEYAGVKINYKILGPILKQDLSEFKKYIESMSPEELEFPLRWKDYEIPEEGVEILRKFTYKGTDVEIINTEKSIIVIKSQ